MSLSYTPIVISTLLLPLAAQQYSFQPLSIHGRPTYAQSINNRGAVVGYYSPATGGVRAFKRHANGVLEFVTIPDFYDNISLSGINNFGDMVGYASFSEHGLSITWGFKLTGGSQGTYARIIYADTDSDPFYRVTVNGLNSSGDFVGQSSSFGGFVNHGDVVSTIQFPGASSTYPYGIAWDGTVVGCYSAATGGNAFLRGPQGNFLALKIANALSLCARHINNAAGKIVGSYYDTNGEHGFIYDYLTDLATTSIRADGTRSVPVQVIDYPGAKATVLTGIQESGVIVGWASFSNQATLSFIGTPQPLP